MENASKALIIAGSILVSILIIGLGVYIYNNAASTIRGANLNSQEAQAQNQQFQSYFGEKVSAAEIKQMLGLVRSNNITGNTAEEAKSIAIYYQDGNTLKYESPSAMMSILKAGKTYFVGTANDNADKKDEDPTLGSDNNARADGDTANEKDAAYYTSGFLRIITIRVNSNSTGSTTNGNK